MESVAINDSGEVPVKNTSRKAHLVNSVEEMTGCFSRLRRSNQLVVIVNFFAMVTGIMVVSVLQPILPDLLDVMWQSAYAPREQTSTQPVETLIDDGSENTVITTPLPNNSTYPQKPFIIGSLLGFAPLVEIFFTPVAVLAIKWFGFKKTMIVACLLQLFGCYAIAYARLLYLLYAARITQAISVIFATVAGFSLIAVRFKNDEDRSHALTTSMHGFPIGILVAYPCGTALYSYFGITMPFIAISGLSIIATILVLLIKETDEDRKCQQSETTDGSYCQLLSNRTILLSLAFISFSWSVAFLLGATTPNRMSTFLNAQSWQIGLVLFVSTLMQVVTSAIVGKLAGTINRWRVTFVGNLIACGGLVGYPFCTHIYYTIAPETAIRVGWGLVTSSMGPFLGTLVERSHGMAYIRVYALFMSFNLFGGFAGSLFGGWLDGIIGFDYLYWGSSIVTFFVAVIGYCFTCCVPTAEELEFYNESTYYIGSDYQPILDSDESYAYSTSRRRFSSSFQHGVA